MSYRSQSNKNVADQSDQSQILMKIGIQFSWKQNQYHNVKLDTFLISKFHSNGAK